MAERFSAFSFVDRITALAPGRRAAGRFHVPRHVRRFPAALVAEATGQLAAWVAMAHVGFRRRPVAALAGETRFLGAVAPGQTLELAVEIETCDEDGVAYGGSATVDGERVLELAHCLGPMLPQEEFDSPDAVRADFETLCGPGAPADRFPGVPEPELVAADGAHGDWAQATMQVPAAAAFFGDHFPRRPVFPATLLLDAKTALAMQLAQQATHWHAGRALALERVRDVKMRSWILPGQRVELRAELAATGDDSAKIKLLARVAGATVATGRAEITARAVGQAEAQPVAQRRAR